jgi:hypothetical protein
VDEGFGSLRSGAGEQRGDGRAIEEDREWI